MGLLSSVLAAVMALSSVQDSAKVASNDEKTIMLNAESASKPREINIGFSTSGDGAIVYIDGTKHSYGILKGYWHWPGGNSYQQNGVINLLDAVITTGEIAVVLDSHTKLGGDKLIEEGSANLIRLRERIDYNKMKEPSFMMVLCGVAPFAYRRKDGVLVVPIGCLKP